MDGQQRKQEELLEKIETLNECAEWLVENGYDRWGGTVSEVTSVLDPRNVAKREWWAEEYAWLVELKPSVTSVPTYYGENEEGTLGWTTEDSMAVRFARRRDAERIIQLEGWTEAFACEHSWGGERKSL